MRCFLSYFPVSSAPCFSLRTMCVLAWVRSVFRARQGADSYISLPCYSVALYICSMISDKIFCFKHAAWCPLSSLVILSLSWEDRLSILYFYILYLLTGLERQAVHDPSHDFTNEHYWMRPNSFIRHCPILIWRAVRRMIEHYARPLPWDKWGKNFLSNGVDSRISFSRPWCRSSSRLFKVTFTFRLSKASAKTPETTVRRGLTQFDPPFQWMWAMWS